MDILRDSSRSHLLQISRDFEIPGYVVDAPLLEKDAAADVGLFADPYSMEYPLSSAADTWLSAAYFAEDGRDGGPAKRAGVEDAIRKAAAAYGISEDVEKVLSHGFSEKKAEDDGCYGLPEEKAFPMFDRRGVKLACEYFSRNRFDYDAAERRRIASAIEKRAKEEDVDVPDEVRCECGDGVPCKDHMVEQVEQRADMAKGTELDGVLDDLLKKLKSDDGSGIGEELDRLEEVLNEFDKAIGADKEYGRKCMCPADFLHAIPVEDAEKLDSDTIEMDGDLMSLSGMSMLPHSVFSDTLGDDFLSSVMEGGSIVPSMLRKALGGVGNGGRRSVMMVIRRM